MNYRFTYDEEFRQKYFMDLSDEEAMLVRIIVGGGHDSILYGYQPERLVKAIKRLTELNVVDAPSTCSLEDMCGGGEDLHEGYVSKAHGGVLVMENLTDFRSSVLQMVRVPMENGVITLTRGGETKTLGARFQLIATMQGCVCGNIGTSHECLCSTQSIQDWWKKVECIKDKCPIIYKCVESGERHMVEVPSMKSEIESDKYTRHYRSGSPCTNRGIEENEAGMMQINFTSGAREIYDTRVVSANLCKNKFNIARVARTVADMRGHNQTRIADIEAAIMLYNPACV